MSYPSRHEHVQQQCELCPATVVAETLPGAIRKRQAHLREAHPDEAYRF